MFMFLKQIANSSLCYEYVISLLNLSNLIMYDNFIGSFHYILIKCICSGVCIVFMRDHMYM